MDSDSTPSKGLLTDEVVDYLEAQLAGRVLIGDGIAPNAGGWTGGQPGDGEFLTYVVVKGGALRPNNKSPLGMDNDSWLVDYQLLCVGGNRQQADWAGDRTLDALRRFPNDYGDANWRVLRVMFSALGAVSRNDQVDPPLWERSDSVTLYLERS